MVTDKPVTHIINTHSHGDHTGSNDFFPPAVEIVAHENTAANMRKMSNFLFGWKTDALPDTTFRERFTLFSGRDTIDLYHFGPAHTGGDAFVVFPAARAMHAGDVFAGKGVPAVDASNGGSGIAYPDTLRKAVSGIGGVSTVITGHDGRMTWADLAEYARFTEALVDAARRAHDAGKTADQAAAELDLPDEFGDHDTMGAAAMFTAVFAELRDEDRSRR
jgi:glyoxylase-like metal-dependent hydrolase (beta-lactamase superfamily II)